MNAQTRALPITTLPLFLTAAGNNFKELLILDIKIQIQSYTISLSFIFLFFIELFVSALSFSSIFFVWV